MDLKINTGANNRNNIDHEQGTLERLETELKNTVFGVLFVLLKEHEISIYTSIIFSIIHFLQVIVFAFHKTIAGCWVASDITDVVRNILNFLNIVNYMKDTNWDLYLTFFYIGIFVMGLVGIGILYVSYIFSRKKASFTWPVLILKNILMLFTSILFVPFLDYFVSVVGCVDNEDGISVHAYFSEVECWKETYIVHGIIAIVASILFLVISLTASITFFEYKTNSNDPTARVSSRPNFLMTLYQAIMVICLTFLTGDEFEVILLAIILVGSIVLFIKFYFNSPYHDEIMRKLCSTLASINLWTAVMLIFSRIMEDTLFEGTVIAWIIGIPFVMLIVLTNRDHRIDLLLINVTKFQHGAEVRNQIRYILKLMQWQATNRNATVLLDGYIEIHKQSCNKEDCPLRQKVVKNTRFTKSLLNQDETLSEKYAVLVQLLYRMYFDGIKKFPNNTALRISYAFFLLEKMHSKQQALQELTQAEQNKPSFDEQFIIFRYKRILEDEIAESQNDGQGGLDVVSEVAFQNHLRQLQANIEKSALLHMEFWSQLSEDNPDLSKLNDGGSKINSSVQNVEDNWIKLMKINPNSAKAMRLYGKYLIEIINDKEAGDQLLERARNLMNVQSNKKALNLSPANADDLSSEATPTVWISGEQDKLGIVTGINIAAASLFGYNKTEVMNRKVNMLMPQIISKYHDSFLDNYLNNGESAIIGKNKERLAFGKNKSNYIFPFYLNIKAVQSIIQGIQFIATFRIEKNFKNAAYVLAYPDGTIDAMSSSCINVLKLDQKILHKKASIEDYLPKVLKDRHNIFSSPANTGKASATLHFEFPRDSEYLRDNDGASTQLFCHLSELVFLGGRENAGFCLKLEKAFEKGPSSLQVDRKAKISNFQFKFEKNKPTIIGEYANGSSVEIQSEPSSPSRSDGDHNESNADAISSRLRSHQDEEPEVIKRVDYGVGIRTLRLFMGKPQEIEDYRSSENEEEADENKSEGRKSQKQEVQLQNEEDIQDEGSYRDFNTAFKSRKALNTVINDRTPPSIIRNLKWIANGLCVVLLIIAIVDYVIAVNEYNDIQDNIDLLDKSNLRLAELMNVLAKTRDLGLINVNVKSALTEKEIRDQLKTSLDEAKRLKEELEADTSTLSEHHLQLLNNPVITLYSMNSTSTKKGLTQAVEEIISRGFELYNKDTNQITPLDGDYFYITYNLLNALYTGLRMSSEFYSDELVDKITGKDTTFLLLLIASFIAVIAAAIILLPIFYQVNKAREEILSLFLDIPEKTVKGLYNKCETFISNLQAGEEDDMLSEIDEGDLDKNADEPENNEYIPRKKRKRFKNSGSNQKAFFLKFLVMAVLLEAYFLYNFISSTSLLDDINTVVTELNATSFAEPFYSFANNAERQMFIEGSFPVLGTSSQTVVTSNIKAMYDLDSLILQEHSINRQIHSDRYTDVFNQIMMVNPCESLKEYIPVAECQAFADLTVNQGMTVALTRHFENLRALLSCYTKLQSGENCTIDISTNITIIGDSELEKKKLSLILTSQAREINRMQHLYIKYTFRTLMEQFKESINDDFDSEMTKRLIIFIVFIVAVFSLYLVLWMPLVKKISSDIWRTKSMLSMIPLGVIAKIKNIRLYLKKFWNDRNFTDY